MQDGNLDSDLIWLCWIQWTLKSSMEIRSSSVKIDGDEWK
jgi:hypothetical protein